MARNTNTVRIVGPEASPHTALWVDEFRRRGWCVRTVGLSTAAVAVSRRRIIGRVLAEWRRSRPELCVIHSLGTHGLLGALLPRARRTVVVPWGSEVDAATRSATRRRAASFVLRRADLLLTTSRAMAAVVTREWPRAKVDVQVRSWGVADAALSDRGATVQAAVRTRLGLTPEHLIVLAPRGLGAVYRHEEVRSAFVAAQAVRPLLRLVEIDTTVADQRRGPLRSNGTTLTLPRQSHEDLLELFAAADAVVSLPRADQRSTTVVEAIASGARVLLADLPVYRELADEGADVTLLSEPVAASLAAALTAPGSVGVRVPANLDWARENENRTALFDEIAGLSTRGAP